MNGLSTWLWMTAILIGAALFWPEQGLYFRRQRQRWLQSRAAMEDALMHLHQRQHSKRAASAESLAGTLHISTPQALGLIDRMAARGLVNCTGTGILLTTEGHRLALQVVRAHRLFERFLADEARLPLQEVHAEAHYLEHRTSARELDRLEAELGHPAFDPHGDPIPSQTHELSPVAGRSLVDWPADVPARIVHVEDEPPAAFAQIAALGLMPGTIVTVLSASPRQLLLEADGVEQVLAPVVAANISVAAVPESVRPAARRLSTLAVGQQSTVHGFDQTCQGLTRRRFLDLGLTPGTEVQAVMASPLGDPLAYRVRGTVIALRKDQSELILIEAAGEAS